MPSHLVGLRYARRLLAFSAEIRAEQQRPRAAQTHQKRRPTKSADPPEAQFHQKRRLTTSGSWWVCAMRGRFWLSLQNQSRATASARSADPPEAQTHQTHQSKQPLIQDLRAYCAARPASLSRICAGEIGLTSWASNPAWALRRRSSFWPHPVTATRYICLPQSFARMAFAAS